MIPEKTKGSVKDGVWMIYEDDLNTIQIWSSLMSGKEKIYLNGSLISEKRNLKRISDTDFNDENGTQYSVRFNVSNIMAMQLFCIIKRNDERVKTFRVKFSRERKKMVVALVLIVFIVFIISVLKFVFKTHFEFLIPLLILISLIPLLVIRKRVEVTEYN